jgi:hypothetical protein
VAVAEVELTRDALIVHVQGSDQLDLWFGVQGSVRTLGKEVRFVLD